MYCYVICFLFFFFNDTATTEIYTYLHTLSLHDALPIYFIAARSVDEFLQQVRHGGARGCGRMPGQRRQVEIRCEPEQWASDRRGYGGSRSEEHTSELQSLMRISYAVFCLKKKKKTT